MEDAFRVTAPYQCPALILMRHMAMLPGLHLCY